MTNNGNTATARAIKRRASTERFRWNDVVLSVRHQPDYILKDKDHIVPSCRFEDLQASLT
jgi:hypothetical protein